MSAKRKSLEQDELPEAKKTKSVLDSIQINSLCKKPKKVVVLTHNATVNEALDELSKHHILSAPVVLNASLEDNESGTYMGMVDLQDVLFHFRRNVLEEAEKSKLKDDQVWSRLREAGEEFVKRKLVTVMGDDATMIYLGNVQATLRDVLKNGFLREKPIKHRLAVFDGRGRIVNIVSQSDVVRYFFNNGTLESQENKTLEELEFLKDVVSVSSSESAIVAFSKMSDQNLSAVGIVDQDGKLIANLSASDLRGLTVSDFEYLSEKVTEFIVMKKAQVTHTMADVKLISCPKTSTLKEVMRKMVQHHKHRIYIVDEDVKPIGVVTCTDILRLSLN